MPEQETRRQQQADAAERRIKELEGKGVKDPEAVKRRQRQKEAAEKAAAQSDNSGAGGLRVN